MKRARTSGFVDLHSREVYLEHYSAMLRDWPRHDIVEVAGRYGRTTVRIAGSTSSPDLVLLHGRYTPSPAWSPIINQLADRFHVNAVDTMGEPGLSTNDRAPVASRRDYIDWLDEVLVDLELKEAHVMGHSFGGWLAARYALHRPQRTASLTLLDPAQVFAPFSPRWLLACVQPFLAPTAANVENLMRWLGNRRPGHDEIVKLAVLGMTGFHLRAPEAHLISNSALKSLRVPTRQLISDGSVVHRPLRAARRAAKVAPTVTSVLIKDSSHFLFHDQPGDIMDHLRQSRD